MRFADKHCIGGAKPGLFETILHYDIFLVVLGVIVQELTPN